MKNSCLLERHQSGIKDYEAPVCEVFSVDTQNIICTSQTEKVDETIGEW